MTTQTDLISDAWDRLYEADQRERALREALYTARNTAEAVGILAIAASLLAIFEFFIILYKVL